MSYIGRLVIFAVATITLASAGSVRSVSLVLGTDVPVETTAMLSSKNSSKGDMIDLRTSADVVVDSLVVIPKGTMVVGQVSDARSTGGMGVTGRLAVRPLYLRIGEQAVRLVGRSSKERGVTGDTIAGMLLLSPLISGRSVTLSAGTNVPTMVEKTVTLDIAAP